MNATPLRLVALLAALVPCAANADGTPGIVKEKPASGPFVKTAKGYMVPYKVKIPGTDATYEMVPIPGGKFQLGSPAGEVGRNKDEGPQIEIEVAPFWMGKYEVTWGEYKKFMDMCAIFQKFEKRKERLVDKKNFADAVTAPSKLYDPSFTYENGEDPQLPAVTMSQYAAKQYTKWLSKLTGRFYQIPGEAQWEYACRAGTTTAYHFGDDPAMLPRYGWFTKNSDETTHKVGAKQPNPWGLYDMYGNAAEWVLDQHFKTGYKKLAGKSHKASEAVAWPTELYPRVIRGGHWDSDAKECRSASRYASEDDDWRVTDPNLPTSPFWFTDGPALGVGFRIIRPLDPPPKDKHNHRYWNPDTEFIAEDVATQLGKGRGANGIVDKTLPQAIEKLEKK